MITRRGLFAALGAIAVMPFVKIKQPCPPHDWDLDIKACKKCGFTLRAAYLQLIREEMQRWEDDFWKPNLEPDTGKPIYGIGYWVAKK